MSRIRIEYGGGGMTSWSRRNSGPPLVLPPVKMWLRFLDPSHNPKLQDGAHKGDITRRSHRPA